MFKVNITKHVIDAIKKQEIHKSLARAQTEALCRLYLNSSKCEPDYYKAFKEKLEKIGGDYHETKTGSLVYADTGRCCGRR